ncbi:hypothetical protein COY27_04755 [Candidatus Woesearchaeota archaeon CG_4_10_14_0_2_um_filter_33_13]|nr:MAG: hypothetical protein COY27_04755 [Candidatus Woesearchaeota archaeon CG_4_10_14_0_2_um_filter_33_13]
MAKVITYSHNFQKTHPRSGDDTFFVEKFYNSLGIVPSLNELLELNPTKPKELITNFFHRINVDKILFEQPKHNTIRAGNRFKKGEYFSPRIWSGKPYCSPQIILAKDQLITQTYTIEIYPTTEITINKRYFGYFGSKNFYTLATNDGLSGKDFVNWFNKLPFKGQIICWSKEVEYDNCEFLGCDWRYNFPISSIPNKAICTKCFSKHKLNLSNLVWEKIEEFDGEKRTDKELATNWFPNQDY